MVSVKFNDQHIPDSPFKVHVAPATGDVQKLRVENLGEQSLQVCLITVSWAVRLGKFDTSAQSVYICFHLYIIVIYERLYSGLWTLHPLPDLLWNSTLNVEHFVTILLFSKYGYIFQIWRNSELDEETWANSAILGNVFKPISIYCFCSGRLKCIT